MGESWLCTDNGDLDREPVAAAVAGRRRVDVYEWGEQLEFHGGLWGDTGLPFVSTSPYARRVSIEDANLPTYIWVSWLDGAMADAALKRYLTFDTPEAVIIGPWSHGAMHHVDPFLPADTKVEPSSEEQFEMLVAFFDAYLKDGDAPKPEAGITYYTLGAGTWNTTRIWPPEGGEFVKWFFGEGHSLVASAPANPSGSADVLESRSSSWHALPKPPDRLREKDRQKGIVACMERKLTFSVYNRKPICTNSCQKFKSKHSRHGGGYW